MSKRTVNTIICDMCGAEGQTEGEGNRSMGFAKGFCENVPKGWGSGRFDVDETDGYATGWNHLCPDCSRAIHRALRDVQSTRLKHGPVTRMLNRLF